MENKEELKNAITVESVSMHFNMATEKVDSLRKHYLENYFLMIL